VAAGFADEVMAVEDVGSALVLAGAVELIGVTEGTSVCTGAAGIIGFTVGTTVCTGAAGVTRAVFVETAALEELDAEVVLAPAGMDV